MEYIKDYVDNLKEDKELLISKLQKFNITPSGDSLEELVEDVLRIRSILDYQDAHYGFDPKVKFPADVTDFDTTSLNYIIYNTTSPLSGNSTASTYFDILDLTHIKCKASRLYNYFNYVPAKIIDISTWDTSSVTSMEKVFNDVSNGLIEEIRLPDSFVTHKCTSLKEVFLNCYKLKRLDLRGWDVSNCGNLYRLIYNCKRLQYLNVSGWNTSKVSSLEEFLCGMGSLNSTPTEVIGLEDLDTSSVKNMQAAFKNANIEYLDLSNWDTSNVTNFYEIFVNSKVKELNISGWKLKSIYRLDGTFYDLPNLESINFSNTKISDYRGDSLYRFISSCPKLKTLDLQCFDPTEFLEKCTSLSSILTWCSDLETANLSYLNCRPISISYFAAYCNNLKYLDIRNIDLKDVTEKNAAFSGVPNDCTIIVRDNVAKDIVLQCNPNFQNIIMPELSELKILSKYTTIGLNAKHLSLDIYTDTHAEEQTNVRFEITGPATIDEDNVLTLTDEAKGGDSIIVTAISTYDETIRDTKTFEVLENLKEIIFAGDISEETDSEKWLKRETTFKGLQTYGITTSGSGSGGKLLVTTRGYNKLRVYVEYRSNTGFKYFEIRNIANDSSLLKISKSDDKPSFNCYTFDIDPEESNLALIATLTSTVSSTFKLYCDISVEAYNE